MVVACSALRRAYREAILAEAPGAVFVQLDGSHQLLEQRMDARVGHFMPPSLLRSQLALYEPLAPDEPGVRVPITGTPDEIAADAIRKLSAGAGSQSRPPSQN
jgi:carbohydrate kinase (thermoresistant glucokinase family)